jgi:hypothetical protein
MLCRGSGREHRGPSATALGEQDEMRWMLSMRHSQKRICSERIVFANVLDERKPAASPQTSTQEAEFTAYLRILSRSDDPNR